MKCVKRQAIAALLCFAIMLPANSEAVDPVEANPDIYAVIFENADLRLMELTYEPGQGDDWHSHPPYTVYVLDIGRVRVYDANGNAVERDVERGPPRRAEPVARHRMEKIGATTVRLLAIELKNQPPPEEERVTR